MAANRWAISARASFPRDRLEPALALAADSSQRLEQAIGAIDPLEVAGHLLAEETAREAMIGVAAKVDRHAVLDGHEHAARVGAVERADGFDDGQGGILYRCRHGDSLRSNAPNTRDHVRVLERLGHAWVRTGFDRGASPGSTSRISVLRIPAYSICNR